MKRLVVSALTFALLAVPMVGSTASAATPKCNGVKATIVGNDRANILRGTNKRDVIVAKGGADRIYGRGGNDLICAGKGKDVVLGGNGKDKIFGQDGNDKLKGGAGWDVLNGGPRADACYVNADGGKTINCEEADLVVTVESPASVESGQDVRFDMIIKNVGGKPATGVELEVAWTGTNVSCTDFVDTVTLGWIKPGDYRDKAYWQACSALQDEPRTVLMEVSVSTTATEDILANNEDESTTTVVPKP